MVRHRAVNRRLLAASLAIFLTGCNETPSAPFAWNLLDANFLPEWKSANIENQGRTFVNATGLRMEEGSPMTGLVFSAWEEAGLPSTRYAIEYEARRTRGTDFFGALTFPVNESYLTFVPGGWSGATTGLSNIDGLSAIDNPTGSAQRYEQGVWYRFRIEVSKRTVKVWMDARLIVNLQLPGRSIDLRPGDIEKCKPFGFATYGTDGEVRSIRIESLPGD